MTTPLTTASGFMGWTSVTTDAKLVCRRRGHHTRLLDFYLGRVRILGDYPPEKGQFLVGAGDLGLQFADRALHLLALPGLSYGGGFQLRHLGAQLGNRGLVGGNFVAQRGPLLERRKGVESGAVAAELEHPVNAARHQQQQQHDGDDPARRRIGGNDEFGGQCRALRVQASAVAARSDSHQSGCAGAPPGNAVGASSVNMRMYTGRLK